MILSTLGRRAAARACSVLALTLMMSGCDLDSLLEVTDPDIVPGDLAADPELVGPLGNGALFEFARAYSGTAASNDQPGVVGFSGLLADEVWYASTFPTSREIDSRAVNTDNTELDDFFHRIQRARNAAEVVAGQYAAGEEANTPPHAFMLNLAGFGYIFLSENFCSGVPYGTLDINGRLTYGPGHTSAEVFQQAVARFDEALSVAATASSDEQTNLARIGKARALLDLGQFSEAAAVAAQVPDGFVHVVDYSPNSSGQQNGVWNWITSNRRGSVASLEGTENRGLEYFTRGTGDGNTIQTSDPRVPVRGPSEGIGTTNPVYSPLTFSSGGDDIVLASYVEARLIQAEAQLDGGNSNAYLTILNDLRENVATFLPDLGIEATGSEELDPLTDPGSANGRVEQLFNERARWLWLTGHRLSDLRRMIRQYGFAASDVFPTGTPIFGGVYGTDVNFPIPFQERNNPEFAGECIDRNA